MKHINFYKNFEIHHKKTHTFRSDRVQGIKTGETNRSTGVNKLIIKQPRNSLAAARIKRVVVSIKIA